MGFDVVRSVGAAERKLEVSAKDLIWHLRKFHVELHRRNAPQCLDVHLTNACYI